MKINQRNNFSFLKEYAQYSNLIIQMLALVAFGIVSGMLLDNWLKTRSHLFMIILCIFMTTIAIIYMFKQLLKKKSD